MYRVVVDLVSGSRTDTNTIRAESRAEPARSGSLVVHDPRNKIVLDYVVIAAAEVYSVSAPCLSIVVANSLDIVVLDRERTIRAQDAYIDGVTGCTRSDVAFNPDRVATDHTIS